jgi:GTP cyclohydrolase II
VADILRYFQVASVEIMTNNPEKISSLEEKGIKVVGRIPLVIAPNRFNQYYLDTKRSKMNHYIG